jgi:inorganic pyrophosphatase
MLKFCTGGKNVSAWHDIPLWAEDGLLNFICEIPKESSAKMEVATVRKGCNSITSVIAS